MNLETQEKVIHDISIAMQEGDLSRTTLEVIPIMNDNWAVLINQGALNYKQIGRFGEMVLGYDLNMEIVADINTRGLIAIKLW